MTDRKPELPTDIGPERASLPVTAFVLEVVAGPDRGARVVVDSTTPGVLLVGTSAACQLVLSDRRVSRRHVSVELVPGGLHVKDLGSTNGTSLGGTRILDAFGAAGDELRLGSETVLSITPSDAPVKLAPAGTGFGRVVGASPVMRRLYPVFQRLASSDIPVLIEGERGAGKELLAEVLHESGPRAGGPFVVVDVSALASDQVEPELLAAIDRSKGGTLLIEEIGELPVSTQEQLARALTGAASGALEPSDVRLIATSRRNLDKAVEESRFRDDLFFALAPGRVELPPLRARGKDVALLAEHFWRRLGGGARPLPSDFLSRHEGYEWPENVRELQAAVAHLSEIGDAPSSAAAMASAEALPDTTFDFLLDQDLAFVKARDILVTEFERRYVARALEKHGGNVSRAAATSGLARRSFQLIRARLRR